MRILIIIPKLANGGIEKISSNFSLNLPEEYKQYIFSIMNQSESYEFKIPPIILEQELGRGVLGKFFVFQKRLGTLKKILDKNEIDVCISFGERCNILNILASRYRVKTIITIHSQLSIENSSKGFYGKISTLLAKFLYKKANKIVCVSRTVEKDFSKIFKGNITTQTIYNGHELTKITELSNNEVVQEKIDFISIGRITFAKGHFHLLRALSIVKKDYPNVKLCIIGTYEKDNLQSILLDVITKYNLESNVIFTGYKANPYPYLKSAKALVLSSIFEGFPGVVVESLHLGVPVIASNCGGATEVIAGKTAQELTIKPNESLVTELGIITPTLNGVYDITANYYDEEITLAENMSLILSKKILFDSETLISSAQKFDISEMINQYDKILKGLGHERSY